MPATRPLLLPPTASRSSRRQGCWLLCSYLTPLLGRQTGGSLLILPKCKLNQKAKSKLAYKGGSIEMHD